MSDRAASPALSQPPRLIGLAHAGLRRASLRDVAILTLLVALFVALCIGSPVFLTKANLLNILQQNAPVAIMALGATVVVIAGGLDISVGAIYGLSAVVGALVANAIGGPGGWVAGLLVGAAAGGVNGLLVVGLRVNSLLVTLGTTLVFQSAASVMTNTVPVSVSNPTFAKLGQGTFLGLGWSTWALFATILVVAYLLRRSVFGRYVYALGGNADAARLSGVPVARVILAVFLIGGITCGLAGTIGASSVAQGSATSGAALLFPALTAVFLGGNSVYGGEGAVWRTLVGVAILALLNNGFNLVNLPPLYQPMIQGALIVGAVGLDAWSTRRGAAGSHSILRL